MPELASTKEEQAFLYDQHIQDTYHLKISKRATLFNELTDLDGVGTLLQELRETPKLK